MDRKIIAFGSIEGEQAKNTLIEQLKEIIRKLENDDFSGLILYAEIKESVSDNKKASMLYDVHSVTVKETDPFKISVLKKELIVSLIKNG